VTALLSNTNYILSSTTFVTMSSGVLVNPECQTVFQQLSEGTRTLRYIIYKIEDKEVVVERAVSSEEVSHISQSLSVNKAV